MRDKKIFSWALYDWANSSYSTTVMAGFFPVFFKQYWSQGVDPVVTTAQLGTTLSISSLLIAILSPTLGAMADMKGSKKLFCFCFMLIAVASSVWMYFIPPGGYVQAMFAYGLGMVTFAASVVFYDSMLPSIARGTKMDDASSFGYALGYLGGGVLFAINVAMLLKPEFFGLADKVAAVKVSFLTVAVWWVVFSIPLFKNVPEPVSRISNQNLWQLTLSSASSLRATVKDIFANRNLTFFILAYWLYIDGVFTVMTMAVDFGMSIGLESKDLLTALLITQFVGFPFAWGFGKITGIFGCRKPILLCLVVYSVSVVLATQMSQAWHFYALAVIIGMVQGGVQSLSRSLFAHMVPKERSGEFFGFYNLIGKFASIVGPLLVAVTVTVTGNSRFGLMGLIVLFVIGGILLWKTKEPVHAPA